jgi:tetratricopeptide (TPR) repeat protein
MKNLFILFTLCISMQALWCPDAGSRTVQQEGEVSQLFVQANQLYNKGAFDEARKRYEQIISQVRNGALYYNLGNIYLKQGKLGYAIHAYRNAWLYNPRDEDLQANLAYARSRTKDQLENKGAFSVLRSLCFWYDAFSFQELFYLFLVLNCFFWTTALVRLWVRGELLYWLFLGSLSLLLLTGGTWATKAYDLFSDREAVVLENRLPVRSGNDLQSTTLFYLHEGAEVDVVAQNSGWIKIMLPDGKKGWAQKKFMGLVGETDF